MEKSGMKFRYHLVAGFSASGLTGLVFWSLQMLDQLTLTGVDLFLMLMIIYVAFYMMITDIMVMIHGR